MCNGCSKNKYDTRSLVYIVALVNTHIRLPSILNTPFITFKPLQLSPHILDAVTRRTPSRYINRASIASDALIAALSKRCGDEHACDTLTGRWPSTPARNKSLDKRQSRSSGRRQIAHTWSKRSVNHGRITVSVRPGCSHA